MSKKVILIYALIMIVVGAGAMMFINRNYANHPMMNASLQSNVVAVKNTDRTADLGFEKSGKIIFIAKKIGDHVVAGEVLAKIDNADVVAQYSQARAGVLVAQADLAALQNSLKKEKLKLKGLPSNDKKIQQKQIDSVESNVNAQEARVLQAQDNARNISTLLEKVAIKAPFDGKITRQDIELGEVANPNVSVIAILAENK